MCTHSMSSGKAMSKQAKNFATLTGTNPDMVWNFPIDLTFQSSSAFGWPKLHFGVYGIDFLGADIVQGYGFTHVPCCCGR